MIGGHDRTISPLLDTHVFTLRDESFLRDESSARNAAVATWHAVDPDGTGFEAAASPEPRPRGFHCAVHCASLGLGVPPKIELGSSHIP